MVSKRSALLSLTFLMIVTSPFETEAARVCKQKITLPAPEAGTCDIDSSNPKMGNPFAYIDPTQGCDFSFSLPGLPSFSLEGIGEALCNEIQDIGQEAIDDALGPILDEIPSSIDLDMSEMMSDIFDDQIEMQQEFCPVYSSDGKLITYECEREEYDPIELNPIEIEDPDYGDKECYVQDGYKYCTDPDDSDGSGDDSEPYDPNKDMSLPLCSELTDFYDENGNVIECRNGAFESSSSYQSTSSDYNTYTVEDTPTESTTSSNKPTWNTKKGW